MKKCRVCGKDFEGRSNAVYCSLECGQKGHRQKTLEYCKSHRVKSVEIVKCKFCGKEFEGNNRTKYCSKDCVTKHIIEYGKGNTVRRRKLMDMKWDNSYRNDKNYIGVFIDKDKMIKLREIIVRKTGYTCSLRTMVKKIIYDYVEENCQ
jgi:hypothetical protein